MPTTTTHHTSGTPASAQALTSGGTLRRAATQAAMIVEVLRASSSRSMTAREIQAAIEAQYARRLDMCSISARINGMVSAGRLARVDAPRLCTVTGYNSQPVYLVAQQAALIGDRHA